MQVIVSPRARRDLQEIHDFIADDNPHAALKFLQKVEANFFSLQDSPGIGRRREEVLPGMRSVTEGAYIIFYQVISKTKVQIVRVLHGARDMEQVFDLHTSSQLTNE